MRRVSQMAGVLFVFAVPLFLITASVAWAINDPGVYHRGFEKYNISLLTGITKADLRQAGADIRRYFNSRDEPLVLRTRVFGIEREIFNQREVTHMGDVKGLIQRVYVVAALSGAYILAIAGVGLLRFRRSYMDTLARLFLWGGAITLALVLAVGLFALVGFDTLFLKFHQLSFSNAFWQLDPRTDYLIIMFPQGFWFDATMGVATSAVGGATVLAALSGGYLAYRYWVARKESLGQGVEGICCPKMEQD